MLDRREPLDNELFPLDFLSKFNKINLPRICSVDFSSTVLLMIISIIPFATSPAAQTETVQTASDQLPVSDVSDAKVRGFQPSCLGSEYDCRQTVRFGATKIQVSAVDFQCRKNYRSLGCAHTVQRCTESEAKAWLKMKQIMWEFKRQQIDNLSKNKNAD